MVAPVVPNTTHKRPFPCSTGARTLAKPPSPKHLNKTITSSALQPASMKASVTGNKNGRTVSSYKILFLGGILDASIIENVNKVFRKRSVHSHRINTLGKFIHSQPFGDPTFWRRADSHETSEIRRGAVEDTVVWAFHVQKFFAVVTAVRLEEIEILK